MSRMFTVTRFVGILATLLAVAASAQTPLGTEFTYQGNLESSGSPVDGTADFQFKLFNASSAGSQIGSTQSVNNVTVIDGGFTVTLDFGAGAFAGDKRWLEIAARTPAGSGSFVTLTPRQALTASPYALKSRGVDGHSLDASDGAPIDALFVDPDGKVGIGTLPIGGLHIKREPLTFGGTLTLEGDTHTYMAFFPDGAAAGRKGFFGFAAATHSDISLANEIAGGDINLLTTAGGVTSVSILEIRGADLAERFPTSQKIEPGMVVAIDLEKDGQICLARGAYNPAVAGVVSGANGFSVGAVLGNLPGQEDAPPIALSGRVYVWCDASRGPIRTGDLLTTSDTPGHAMKAADPDRKHGAVIGKAMAGLPEGRGLVLALVNLQ